LPADLFRLEGESARLEILLLEINRAPFGWAR
jgi:hypothetical protein